MDDVGIGDRQDDACRARAEPRVEMVLQEHDVGPAERIGLGVHPVIGGEHDGGAQRIQSRRGTGRASP